MRKQWGMLAAVLVIGLVLRCIAINARGIWYDDAFSIFLAERSLVEIIHGTAADTMPPLYYFLLHAWQAIGNSIAWIRLLNVTLSVAILVLLYLMGKALGGHAAGLAAAFLGAVSPLQIYHAQEVRMYVLLALTQLGYAWFFLRILQAQNEGRSDGWAWAGLLVSGTAAMYSHNLAVFALAVPTFYLVIQRRWRLLGRILLVQALIGILALPWLLLVPGQINKIQQAFWTPRPCLVEILQALILFHGNMPLPAAWMALVLFLSMVILIILILESRRWWQAISERGLLLSWILLPPAMLFIVSYIMRPVFVPRGFIVSTLVYLVLAGVLIAKSWKNGVGKLLLGAFTAAALISLPYQYQYDEFPRSPFQQAAAYLEQAVQPDVRVIHDNKLSYFPMAFYRPDLAQVFLADEPGSHNDTLAYASQAAMNLYAQPDLAYSSRQAESIYFVVFTKAIMEYQASGLEDHPRLAWLNDHYQTYSRHIFGDLEIYQFEQVK
jgi:4-amino-4-deoxy-L-arabinose transferase-like glycosyltransferase